MKTTFAALASFIFIICAASCSGPTDDNKGDYVARIDTGTGTLQDCPPTEYQDPEYKGGGKSITPENASDLVAAYRAAHEKDDGLYKTTGFFLSKRMFDKIFCDPQVNSVNIDLVDNNGQLQIVVSGEISDSTEIDDEAASVIFINELHCPNDCSQW
jgi:hypothetical protein